MVQNFVQDYVGSRRELWKTDGTEDGTEQVIDINVGYESAFGIHSFCINENVMFFSATNGINGFELWKTDEAGTEVLMVKDINSGNESATPSKIVKIGDYVYFRAFDAIHGSELWKTDGSESGTELVVDILPGNLSSSPSNIILVDKEILFIAELTDFGRQIWRIPYSNTSQILEPINNIELSIYPNPTNSILYVNGVQISNISIFDLTGKMLINKQNVDNQINVSNLQNGIYSIKITNESRTVIRKFVKQ